MEWDALYVVQTGEAGCRVFIGHGGLSKPIVTCRCICLTWVVGDECGVGILLGQCLVQQLLRDAWHEWRLCLAMVVASWCVVYEAYM